MEPIVDPATEHGAPPITCVCLNYSSCAMLGMSS